MDSLTQQQALEVLVSGVQVAQRKGAFSLEEAELLARACRVFVKQQEPVPQPEEVVQEPQQYQENTGHRENTETFTANQTPVRQSSLRPPVNDPQNIQTI